MVVAQFPCFRRWWRHHLAVSVRSSRTKLVIRREILDLYLGRVAMLSQSLRIKWLLLLHSGDIYIYIYIHTHIIYIYLCGVYVYIYIYIYIYTTPVPDRVAELVERPPPVLEDRGI